MQNWDGKSKGTPLGYKIFILTLRKGGIRPAYFILRFVAFYYFLFSWKSSANILYYFHKRLGYSRFKSLSSLYGNYYKFGQTILDKIVTMANLEGNYTFDFEGEHFLEEIVAGGKGCILLGAHIGNWEIAGFYLKRISVPVNVVMFDAESEKIKKYLDSVTGGRRMKIIPIKDDLSHIYKINEALQNNELVCVHADRFVEGNRTISRQLLGKPALFPEGVFQLGVSFKVPVTFVFAFKETASRYHFFATRPKIFTGKPKDVSINELADEYVAELENKIRRYPLQWFNYFNFWGEGK